MEQEAPALPQKGVRSTLTDPDFAAYETRYRAGTDPFTHKQKRSKAAVTITTSERRLIVM